MNRSEYFNYIEKQLINISCRIKERGKLNLLEFNIHSEIFIAGLMNNIFSLNLKNINQIKQNAEGIDLIDDDNKIMVQVSSNCTKEKIEKSLRKKIFNNYPNYRFKFVAIVGDASNLRTKNFENPHNVKFCPQEDIYDISSILKCLLNMVILNQPKLYRFLMNELGDRDGIDIVRINSNLATIINILSQENLSIIVDSPEINPFEVLRKIEFNDLMSVKLTIDDYKIYYSKLNEKYKEFDKQGKNKSISVYSKIKSIYNKLIGENRNPYDVFFSVINELIKFVKNSKNYIEIPYEELEMCVSILVVDAFIRCKIFKNPEGYNHVVTK